MLIPLILKRSHFFAGRHLSALVCVHVGRTGGGELVFHTTKSLVGCLCWCIGALQRTRGVLWLDGWCITLRQCVTHLQCITHRQSITHCKCIIHRKCIIHSSGALHFSHSIYEEQSLQEIRPLMRWAVTLILNIIQCVCNCIMYQWHHTEVQLLSSLYLYHTLSLLNVYYSHSPYTRAVNMFVYHIVLASQTHVCV